MGKEFNKRVDIVSIKMVKEKSIKYENRKITSPSDAEVLCRSFLGDSDREQLIAISLDTKNQPTNINVVSIGSLNSSIVHPREVFKVAILTNAFKIICFHNHQSGNTDFSREDEVITKRL